MSDTGRAGYNGSRRALIVPALALAAIVVGVVLRVMPATRELAAWVWTVGLVVTGAPVAWRTLRSALRGHFATDVVAMLAIVSALPLREPVAGLVVVLMQTGGEALERFAERRASNAIRALEEAAPRIAHRIRNGEVEDVRADDVAVGDLLLLRPGELLACDGEVEDGRSHVDISRLTGEPVPVSAGPGTRLLSGSANLDGVLRVRALALAGESQYARIVQLVRTAQASKAPLQRLADRYAVWFTPLTLTVCAVALAATGDWHRVLAILVVATPCPLILATPIAIIGGINQAARRQIIVRHGGALEQMEQVGVAVFDKTGTLTLGRPHVSRVVAIDGISQRELLRLAAGVEQGSGHLLARTVVDAALHEGLTVPHPRELREWPGRGVVGTVDGRRVTIGSRPFVAERDGISHEELERVERGTCQLRAYVAVNGELAGAIEYADRLRPGVRELLRDLRSLGVARTLLLSGDHTPNARAVADAVGITEAQGDLLPEDKVRLVNGLVAQGSRVLMVGDGTNDAPALGSATVGVALAGHGGGITAEAADVVVLADDLHRLTEALQISRRTMRIARQSIRVGLALSAAAMAVAALGYIPAVVGALLQEGIDVAVIVNALRTSR